MPPRDRRTELPTINRWLMMGFERHFLPSYLRKHFHVVASNHRALTPSILENKASLVVYCNHASWWDPMLALFLRSQLFRNHRLYAPIDATALEQYKIFKSMGFYGVGNSHRGAAEFLKRSLRILQTNGSSIWITPEGKFCDPRQLDQPIELGLAHLAHAIQRGVTRVVKDASRDQDDHTLGGGGYDSDANDQSIPKPTTWFIPTAIEYPFWEERLPECLCWFGDPVPVEWRTESVRSKDDWHELLGNKLRETQRQLAATSMARDPSSFEVLLRGKSGTWRLYDMARRSWAKLRGKQVTMEHSGLWK